MESLESNMTEQEEYLYEAKWYIINMACYDCGSDASLVGPFETEEDAREFDNNHGGCNELWQGTCATTRIVQAANPKVILKQSQSES